MGAEIRILESRDPNQDMRNAAAIVADSSVGVPKGFALINTITFSKTLDKRLQAVLNGDLDESITLTRDQIAALLAIVGSESYSAGVEYGLNSQAL